MRRWVLSKGMSLSCLKVFARSPSVGRFLTAAVMILSALTTVRSHPPSAEVIKLFPLDLGTFHIEQLSMRPLVDLARQAVPRPDYFAPNANLTNSSPFLGAEAEYSSADGDKLLVEILRSQNDATAYSLFTVITKKMRESESGDLKLGDIGTASFVTGRSATFFKGTAFVRVTNENTAKLEPAIALARLFAATFDKGENDIPVLVKHLPDWQTAQRNMVYAVNIGALRDMISDQTILTELTFEGGTEAVAANYGQSRLVIVEFTTPQFSVDNDQRVTAKIQELKSQGQPVPTAYRRVGNYSVFVFDAPDEKSANQLIDQVKYEQVVQWLGDDPHLYERLQRYFARTTAGVLVSVLKGSGLSLILCVFMGVLIGTLLFRHRRARKAAAYSDAGGTVRLNLDELTSTVNSDGLLGSGSTSKSDPNSS